VVPSTVTHDGCLFSRREHYIKMNVIRFHLHDVYAEKVNKIALSADDNKRVILKDGLHTLAHGNYKLLASM
jgi:hypothetical protein